jgi:cyclohexanecarboxyl-CoA dehydrogenase
MDDMTIGDDLPFAFTDEQHALREKYRDFARKELAPHSSRWAQAGKFPFDALRAMGDIGLMGFTFPKSVGGSNGSWVDFSIALEEVGRADLSCAWIALMGNSYPKLLSDEAVLSKIVSGERLLAFAETEPHSGGDAAAIKATAERRGDEYVINGLKTYVSLVPGADLLLVTALTDPEAGGKRGMSMFLVDTDSPGVTVTEIPEPGVKAHMLGTIEFKDVTVPASSLVGEENRGFYMMRERWDYTRGVGPTMITGCVLQALDDTVERAKAKQTFGRPLLKWQSIQFKLVEHYTKVEAARLLAYNTAQLADNKQRVTRYASMLKYYLAEVATEALADCLEIWGGAAFSETHPVFQKSLDIMGWKIAGGGQDIHKIIIGAELFGADFAAHRR